MGHQVYRLCRRTTKMNAITGFVVPAGGGKHFNSSTPGRPFYLKLLGHETNESIMIFEETLPPGTASLHHLHRHQARRALFLYTPAAAGVSSRNSRKIGRRMTMNEPSSSRVIAGKWSDPTRSDR
jgi:hypothetical protein